MLLTLNFLLLLLPVVVSQICIPQGCLDMSCMVPGIITSAGHANVRFNDICKFEWIEAHDALDCLQQLENYLTGKDRKKAKRLDNFTLDAKDMARQSERWGTSLRLKRLKEYFKTSDSCSILRNVNGTSNEQRDILEQNFNRTFQTCLPITCPTGKCSVVGLITDDTKLNNCYEDDCKNREVDAYVMFKCLIEISSYVTGDFCIHTTRKKHEFTLSFVPNLCQYWPSCTTHRNLKNYLKNGDSCSLLRAATVYRKERRSISSLSTERPVEKFRNQSVALQLTTTVRPPRTERFAINSNIERKVSFSQMDKLSVDIENDIFLKGFFLGTKSFEVVTYFISKRRIEPNVDCPIVSRKYKSLGYNFLIMYYTVLVDQEKCLVNMKGSELVLYREQITHDCTNDHIFVRVHAPYTPEETPTNVINSVVICTNGTVMQLQQHITYTMEGCSNLLISKQFVQCASTVRNSDCKVVKSDKGLVEGTTDITVEVEQEGDIQTKNSQGIKNVYCKKKCVFTTNNEATTMITCPGGRMHILKFSGDITKKCPAINNYFPGRLAPYVCQATLNPRLFYALLIFIILGKAIIMLSVLILDILVSSIELIHKKLKKLSHKGKTCMDCNQIVMCENQYVMHEFCCKNICPYCKNSFAENFVLHVSLCRCKVEDVCEVIEQPSNSVYRKIRHGNYNRMVSRVTYYLIILILFFLVIMPVDAYDFDGFHETSSEIDFFEDLDDNLVECGTSCFRESTECVCSETGMRSKRSLVQHNLHSNLLPPRGFFNPEETFTPIQSARNIELTWESTITLDTSIIVSGNAISELYLEPDTGITWEIKNNESDEKKMISLVVHEYYQNYNFRFVSWVSDRVVVTGTDNTCTGDCSEKCGCHSTTCKIFKKTHARKWTCNPPWCLGVNTGCSCCWVKAEASDCTYLIGEYEAEYVSTSIVICIQIEKPKYTCKTITAGESFDIENFSFRISKVKDVDNKLPTRIFAIKEIYDGRIDISKPSHILLDADICKFSSCSHGEPGDFRFYDIRAVMHDSSLKTVNIDMKWSGLQQDYSCHSFHWPICSAFGVVVNNKDRFDNLIKRSKKIQNSFRVLSAGQEVDMEGRGVLNLKTRPLYNSGVVNAFMSATGVRLNRINIKPIVSVFSIFNCMGCRGCYEGFTCLMKISIENENPFSLHLESQQGYVLVEDVSFSATKELKTYNVTFFSGRTNNEFSVCIVETKDCVTVEANLTEPIDKMVKIDHVVTKQQKDTGHLNYDVLSSIPNFFTSMYGYIKDIINFPSTAIVILITIFILMIFFYLGVPLLKFIACCFRSNKVSFSKEVSKNA